MGDTSLVFNILARDQVSSTFNKLKGTALVAGAAIGAALAGGVAAALDKSKSDAVLAAQLGAGPGMAQEFGKLSGDLYAKGFGEDIGAVNAALKGVWQNGLVPADAAKADIERVTGLVISAAQVMEEDTGRVSAAVSQMLRTGLATSAEQALDLVVKSTQLGINKSEDLLDTLNEYGTQFRKIGLDGPSAMGLISQALKAGARDADTVADALKEFSIRAIDGSKGAADAYRALGLDAKAMTAQIARGGPEASAGLETVLARLKAMKDPVAQSAAAVGLFGTKAEDLGAALYAMDPASAVAALGQVDGAAAKAGETLGKSAGQQLDTFKRKAQMALVEQLGKAVPYIESTFGWLSKNSGWVTPLAGALGGFAIVIGVIVGVTKLWAIAQTALNVVMAMNPIGLIVIAVVGLIAGIVLLWKHSETFRNIVTGAFGAVWDAIKFVWEWIKTNWPLLLAILGGPIGLAVYAIMKYWDQIKGGASAAWEWIVGKWDALVGFVTGLPGRMAKAAAGLWDGVKNSFRSAVNWIIGKWNNLSLRIPAISIPGIGQVWGGMTLHTNDIPYLAQGGTVTASGMAVIHKGETVVPAKTSRLPAAGGTSRMELGVRGGSDGAVARMFHTLVRQGDIQLFVDGQQVTVSA